MNMNKLFVLSFPIVGVISLFIGMNVGLRTDFKADKFTDKVETKVSPVMNSEDNMNIYGKPLDDISCKDSLNEYKSAVEKRCAQHQIELKKNDANKYIYAERDCNDWEDVLYRIYAQIREESTKDEYEEFIQEEKTWESQAYTESLEKRNEAKTVLDKKYAYYTCYTDKASARCEYLLANKVK